MNDIAYGDRDRMVDAIMGAIREGASSASMAQPRPTAKRMQTFMLFAYPTGTMENVASGGVNELIIPNYKQTWANIRKMPTRPKSRSGSPSSRRFGLRR